MWYLKQCCILSLLLFAVTGNAEIYKYTNSQGVTSYSDIKEKDAEEIIPPKGNSIALPKLELKIPADEAHAYYATFGITSPENNATIRNTNGTISLTLKLIPGLKVNDGHRISTYLDGKQMISNSTSLSQSLNDVERGTHTIYAVVSDAEAKTLIQSNTITIFLKQFSKLH